MPNPKEFNDQKEWMKACVPVKISEGKPQDQAVAICISEWEHKDDAPVKQETIDYWIGKFGGGYAEREKLKDDDFVFPDDRAFPITTAQDVMDAVHSWGRYKGKHSFEDFQRRLKALAKRKGFESSLPSNWKDQTAAKFYAVKALDDWTLDVLAIPFGYPDSDGQTFDANTDFMFDAFQSPVVLYHHGVEPGKKSMQKKPTIIGKAENIEVKPDGVHIRVLLNKSLEWARRVWEAAKQGLAVASSDSIAHLARLEVNGKTMMYEKNRPGRISVWPFAGISLWDRVGDNFQPASQYAIALPAMKAIYREAGLEFPEFESDTNGDGSYTDEVARHAKIKQLKIESMKLYRRTSRFVKE